uniref:Four helix bundle protein n=1 Tax=candidate division WWE3 bacterium TaxID=2053526 RepID=A0A831YZV6_UNCKA
MGSQDLLIERFMKFALDCNLLVKSLSKTEENRIYGRQLIRSSSSEGANYVEATAAASRKDFINDSNRARKEAKESLYWLQLIKQTNEGSSGEIESLLDEGEQL